MMAPMIFRKDLQIGLKNLLITPAMLFLAYVILKVVVEGLYGQATGEAELAGLNLGVLFIFNCIIAIVIGAQVSAEEHTAGTDVLLARLPISTTHLYTEKIAAGLCCIGLLYVATLLYLSFFDLDGAWDNPSSIGTVSGNLFIVMLSSFVIAIVCSRFTQQSIAILLISFGAECLLWMGIGVVGSVDAVDWYALRVTLVAVILCFVVPSILVWRQWTLPMRPDLWGMAHQPTPIRGLLWKGFAENGTLHVVCLLLLLATLVLSIASLESIRVGDSEVGVIVAVMGVLLLAALSTNSYSILERKGLHCITYYHPITRDLFYLTKQAVAIPAVLMVSVALALSIQESVPGVSIILTSFFLYLVAVQTGLTFQSGTVVVILGSLVGAWIVIGTILIWMTPMETR